MDKFLLICISIYSFFNLSYLLIILFDTSLSYKTPKIQYKVNNQDKNLYIVGAVTHLYEKLKSIDFDRCTNLGAFISVVHIGIVWGVVFGSATLLSLIISIGNTIVTNFKEKNYNL